MPSVRLALVLAVLLLPTGGAASTDDRPPTADERAGIERVLRAEGFTRWDDIELDDGVWEVDDAIGPDGREHDLELNPQYQIIRRDPD